MSSPSDKIHQEHMNCTKMVFALSDIRWIWRGKGGEGYSHSSWCWVPCPTSVFQTRLQTGGDCFIPHIRSLMVCRWMQPILSPSMMAFPFPLECLISCYPFVHCMVFHVLSLLYTFHWRLLSSCSMGMQHPSLSVLLDLPIVKICIFSIFSHVGPFYLFILWAPTLWCYFG